MTINRNTRPNAARCFCWFVMLAVDLFIGTKESQQALKRAESYGIESAFCRPSAGTACRNDGISKIKRTAFATGVTPLNTPTENASFSLANNSLDKKMGRFWE